VILLNIKLWKEPVDSCFAIFLILFFLGFAFPVFSVMRELDRNTIANGPAMDSFEVVYAYLLFMPYWALMVIQFVVLSIKKEIVDIELDDQESLTNS